MIFNTFNLFRFFSSINFSPMRQLIYLLLLLFTACQNHKSIRRGQDLQRSGYLKTSATTVEMARCCSADSVKIQYIGCGGYLIRRGDDAVLIDPYFSNASFSSMLRLRTDTALIAAFFKENFNNSRDFLSKNAQKRVYTEGSLNSQNDNTPPQNIIKSVLMSHAHHDHLADLPYIFKHHLASPKTQFIASQTANNILQSFKTPYDSTNAFFNLDSIFNRRHAQNDTLPVRWTDENKHLRITAIEAEHAPHFCKLKIPCIGGSVKSVPKRAPRSTFGFKEGRNYNYLIDFLNDKGAIVFRIYSCGGAASRRTVGFLDPSVLREKNVDFLILCGANFDQAVDYPTALMDNIRPERVLVGHWEDFFTPISSLLRTPKTVRFTNIPQFLEIVKAEMLKNKNNTEPILLQPLTPLTIRF
jgi:L-ascorbate metabolism protein UlaG (beta-lactamase superfamily)